MTQIARGYFFVIVAAVAAGCVAKVPLDGAVCPCAAFQVCCQAAGRCINAWESCDGVGPGGGGAGPGLEAGHQVADAPLGGGDPRTALYRITARRNIAAPARRALGITFDGQYFWTLAEGSTTGGKDVIMQFDAADLRVLKSFDIGRNYAQAVAWDGSTIWTTSAGGLMRVDVTTGAILKMMSGPKFNADLDWDGHDLLLAVGGGEIQRIDPVTGGARVAARTFDVEPFGIAFRPGELWVIGPSGLEVRDAANGVQLGWVDGAQNLLGFLTFADGQLVVQDWDLGRGITFFDIERRH
jgi:hypothetical protein